MTDLLKFESDLQTIQIIENYGQMSVADGAMTASERKKYISKVGYLYPERYEMLNLANDFKMLQTAVECTEYHEMLSNVKQAGAENEVESRGKTLGKFYTNQRPFFNCRNNLISLAKFFFISYQMRLCSKNLSRDSPWPSRSSSTMAASTPI